MSKKNKISIFIFRRDLRLEDNTGLINALKDSDKVIPLFIFTDKQIETNEYKSNNAIQFMIDSLKDLNINLENSNGKLHIFKGENLKILKDLISKLDIDSIYVNTDYTPFSINRDREIEELCKDNDVDFNSFHDYMLNPPQKVLKANGEPYTIFTPYYRRALYEKIEKPIENKFTNYYNKDIESSISLDEIESKILPERNNQILRKGGRDEAFKVLEDRKSSLNHYDEKRDFPSIKGTSTLSAHNKFGTISIRELYYYFKDNLRDSEPIIRELYWRDFYLQIAYHFPKVFGKEFNQKYEKVKWEDNESNFKAWCQGLTGFPIVDAGMRELNSTGYMHNRVRMIVASFLTKDLHIDWRLGEKYFAQKLTDYDPSVNNGSWQWAASTGCDAQPYFRIFNPWLQQKRFDEDCEYIKKWVPELKNIDVKSIHKLNEQRPLTLTNDYPKPIVKHSEEKDKAISYYKEIK